MNPEGYRRDLFTVVLSSLISATVHAGELHQAASRGDLAAVDALLRDRHTIFEASAGGRQLYAAPLITRDKLGVKIALRF